MVEGNVATSQLTEVPVGIDIVGLQDEVHRLKVQMQELKVTKKEDVAEARQKGLSDGFWIATTIWIVVRIVGFILVYQPWTWL